MVKKLSQRPPGQILASAQVHLEKVRERLELLAFPDDPVAARNLEKALTEVRMLSLDLDFLRQRSSHHEQ